MRGVDFLKLERMNVKELRIGNYIGDDEGLVAMVSGFKPLEHSTRCDEEEGCIVLIDLYHSKGWAAESLECKPIPITAEWLERFSFTSNGFFRMKRTGRFLFEIPIDEKGLSVYFCDRVLTKIEYIHQLQNLFYALTGEELTLKTELK